MDFIQFKSQNLEYIIELEKRKKSFSYSKFAQYICTIRFKDILNRVILEINCSEKEIYCCIQSINDFLLQMGNMLEDCIHFESFGDMKNYFIWIGVENFKEFPPEEEDISFSVFEQSNQGSILRLSFNMHYYYLEDFMYKLYMLISDISYLNEIVDISFKEYYESLILSFPD